MSAEPRVRTQEWPLVLATGAFAFLAVALAIILRTWSDAAFLDEFQVTWLPAFFIASALVFVPATFVYAWLVRRLGPIWLNTLLLSSFAVFTLACVGFIHSRVLLFIGVLGLAVLSPLANVICWNTILSRLNSRQARRLIPIVGGVSTLGAISAGAGGAELAKNFGTDVLLYVGCGLLLLMIPLPRLVTGAWFSTADQPRPGGVRKGIRALGRNRLLVVVGLGTFLMAVTTNIIDYQFKAYVQTMDRDAMGVFIGRFHGITNVAVLLVQFFAVTPLMRRFGVGWTYALHPVAVLCGAMMTLLIPALAAVVALRFVDTMLKFTFHKDTTELVLNPVPAYDRHQAMVFLKGMIYPLGGITAGLLLALTTRLSWDPATTAGLLVIALAGAWVSLARKVRDEYLLQISKGLAIPLNPQRAPSQDHPETALVKLRSHVKKIRWLSEELHSSGNDAYSGRIAAELDRLFLTLGQLVGDGGALEAAAERYLHGSRNERAGAVELLDTLLHTYRIPDAAELLDALASDDQGFFRRGQRVGSA